MDTTSIRSIRDGVLCGLKPTLKPPMSKVKKNSRKLTPCRDSAGPPLSSGCGPWPHSLEKCWGLKRRRYSLNSFTSNASLLSLTGRTTSARQMGSCEACGRTDLVSLWPGSPVSPIALHWQRSQTKPYKQVCLVCNLFSSMCGVLANKTFKYPILQIPSVGVSQQCLAQNECPNQPLCIKISVTSYFSARSESENAVQGNSQSTRILRGQVFVCVKLRTVIPRFSRWHRFYGFTFDLT